MTSLEKKVLQCASGEKRLNPDELRHYFGTYAERVVLAILLENAEKKTVIEEFPKILKDLSLTYPHLSLKLSPNLYGIIVHSDKAENLDKVLLSEINPDILAPQKTEQTVTKKGFFAKLFGK